MNQEQEALKMLIALRRLRRARSQLMVCFLTLPLYVASLVLLLNNGRSIVYFMLFYMAVYAVFSINMVVRPCPRCRQQFFVRNFFLNPFTRKCMHCGESLQQHREKF